MNETYRLVVAAVLVSLGLLVPSVGFADPDRAAQHYEAASEAYQAGDYRKAADLLERAYAEEPDLVYQYNRVLALEAQGDLDEALRVLGIYEDPMVRDEAKRFSDIVTIRERLEAAQARRAKPEPAEPDEPDAVEPEEETPEVAPEPGTLDEPPPKVRPESGPNWLGWGLVIGGGASAGVGALFASGMFASDAVDSVDCVNEASGGTASLSPQQSRDALNSCYPGELTYAAQYQAYTADQDTLGGQQTLSIVFLSAGAAMLTTGIVLLVLDSGEDGSRAALTPYVGADRAGAAFEMTF